LIKLEVLGDSPSLEVIDFWVLPGPQRDKILYGKVLKRERYDTIR